MSAELFDEAARWAVQDAAAPGDADLTAAVAEWLEMRLRHRSGDRPPDGSFLRILARDAAADITAGWDAERFRYEAALYELPGGLSWVRIEGAWDKLASEPPGVDSKGKVSRRQRRDWPSRPELARELGWSVSHIKRVMLAAGQGGTWPPPRLASRRT